MSRAFSILAFATALNVFCASLCAQKIYWIESGDDSIRRANLDGSDVQTIHRRIFLSPLELDIDPIQGKLYWVDLGTNDVLARLWRSNLDGTEYQIIHTAPQYSLYGVAVDPEGGKVYWSETDYAISPSVMRANLDGSNPEVVAPGLAARGIDLDLVNGRIYVGGSSIRRINLDGSNWEDVVPNTWTRSIALDVSGGKIYWTQGFTPSGPGGAIRRANLNGTNIETLREGIAQGVWSPLGIAIDKPNQKIYWADNNDNGLDPVDCWRANLAVR